MEKWDWGLFPEAETFLNEEIIKFLSHNEPASTFASILERETSSRLVDWVDHIAIPRDEVDLEKLLKMGFKEENSSGSGVLRVEGSVLFPLLLSEDKKWELVISPDSLDHLSHFFSSFVRPSIIGAPYSGLRKLTIKDNEGFVFSAVERRGSLELKNTDETAKSGDDEIADYVEALQLLSSRNRSFTDKPKSKTDEDGLKEIEELIAYLVGKISPSRVADAFFRAERTYWTAKNYAAQVQKLKQDALGLGWGNMDHHTYRSSRRNFASLVRIFELMGLKPRERFYAGTQAGWGAQILEQSDGGKVVFADVDLRGDEKFDFTSKGFSKKRNGGGGGKGLGTVGLWVALNGESILQAGMHHLAARFRFESLGEDLQRRGVGMMKPFSNFPFLKQAFTQAEYWKVNAERANALVKNGGITKEELNKFLEDGAIGSHLENIERDQGFKGFNQNSVSVILKMTDPRAVKYSA